MAEGLIVHKFLGDAREPYPRPQDHVLCLSQKTETWVPESGNAINVTLLNADVTCAECIEWLRA